MAFSQVTSRADVIVVQPVANEITNLDCIDHCAADISVSCDQEMESPVQNSLEQLTENDSDQIT